MKMRLIAESGVALSLFMLACATSQAEDRFGAAIKIEYRRQGQVGRNVGAAADEVAALINDLRSNEMFEGESGAKLGEVNQLLNAVAVEHIPKAAELLLSARDNPGVRLDRLHQAGTEMETVIKHLSRLLAEAGLEQEIQTYSALLQEIIEGQWEVLRGTVRWGREVILEPDDTHAEEKDLAQEQSLLKVKLVIFVEQVTADLGSKSKDNALHEQLKRVLAVLSDHKVEAHQSNAVEAIEEQDASLATSEEQAALLGLQKALDVLEARDTEDFETTGAEAMLKLREIIDLQKALRLAILKLTPEQFAAEKAAHQKEQSRISSLLQTLMADAKSLESAGIPHSLLKSALLELKKAEGAIGQSLKGPTTSAQLRAIRLLEQPLQMAEAEAFPESDFEPPLGLGDFGLSDESSGEGAVSLDWDLGIGGIGADLGLSGRGESGEGVEGGGMSEEGMSLSEIPGMSPGMEDESIRMGSDNIGGRAASRGRQRLGHLARQKRKQVRQQFSGELPPEYRKMVEDYFEVLGAEER
jgi:hypothetical protein